MSIFKKLFGPPDIDGLRRACDVRGLSRALTHKEASIRHSAVQALSSLADPEVAEALTLALDDEDALVRQSACQGLGQLGSRDAVTRVTALLHDTSLDVRLGLEAVTTRLGSSLSFYSATDRDDGHWVFPVRDAAEREMKRYRKGEN